MADQQGLAPAMLHIVASSLATAKAVDMCVEAPLNMQSLQCCHNVQVPRVTRELNPFLTAACSPVEDESHQSKKLVSKGCGDKSPNLTRLTRSQNC
jgi:hypothetical protein